MAEGALQREKDTKRKSYVSVCTTVQNMGSVRLCNVFERSLLCSPRLLSFDTIQIITM